MCDKLDQPVCILCFMVLEKLNERNLVDGKAEFKVVSELEDLPFVVRRETSKYICKKCLNTFKKRQSLKQKLKELDVSIFEEYRKKCNENGIAVKTRNPTKRSLPFREIDTEFSDQGGGPSASVSSPQNAILTELHGYMESNPVVSTPRSTIRPISNFLGSPGFLPIKSPFESSSGYLLAPSASVKEEVACIDQSSQTESLRFMMESCRDVSTQTEMFERSKTKAQVINYDKNGKKVAPVFVKVFWESGERERQLPSNLCTLGKMLVRGTFQQIASAAWHCPELRQHLLKEVLKAVHHECASLCSSKDPSILRKTSKSEIVGFSFVKLQEELNIRAPIFNAVLKTASLKTQDKEHNLFWIPSVSMAAAVCLKNRSCRLTVVQLLVSIILQHSRLTTAMSRLRATRLTTSVPFMHKKLDEYGKNHDEEIMSSHLKECQRLEKRKFPHKAIELDQDQNSIPVSSKCSDSAGRTSSFQANIMASLQQLKDETSKEFIANKDDKLEADVNMPEENCDNLFSI